MITFDTASTCTRFTGLLLFFVPDSSVRNKIIFTTTGFRSSTCTNAVTTRMIRNPPASPPFFPLPLVFWKSFDSLSFAERMDGWSCARSYDHIDRHKPPVYRLKQSELTRQTFSTLSLSTTLRCRLSFLFQDQPRRAELTGHVRSVRFAPILKIRQCSRKVMQQRAPCGPACFSQLFNTRNHGDARRRPQGQRWGLV